MNRSRIVLIMVTVVFMNTLDAQIRDKIKETTTETITPPPPPPLPPPPVTAESPDNPPAMVNVPETLGVRPEGSAPPSAMSNELATNGLKQALSIGADAAVNTLGKMDGFLANPSVKILFPPDAKKIESTLRSKGMNSLCDQLIVSVNRAAETAMIEARPIFIHAIKQMSIKDAMKILTGDKDAATKYLMQTTGPVLLSIFEPIVESNLQRTNASKYWADATLAYNTMPLVEAIHPNLSKYVAQKASDGLFRMVALEEGKIRENPAQRSSLLLQDVFGWADKNK